VFRYSFAFTAISMVMEIALLIAGLEIPGDTPIFALFVLGVAPPLAALATKAASGWTFIRLWAFTAILTAVLSVTFGTVTGLLAPLLIRPVAAYLPALATMRTRHRADARGSAGA
jgi:hypothetical protein